MLPCPLSLGKYVPCFSPLVFQCDRWHHGVGPSQGRHGWPFHHEAPTPSSSVDECYRSYQTNIHKVKHTATNYGWELVVFKVCLALFHKCTHSFLPVFLKMRNFEGVYKVIRPHSCVEMFHNSFLLQYSAMCQYGFRKGKSEHLFPLCQLAFFVKIRSRCQVHLAEVLGKSVLGTMLYYS